MLKVPQKAHNMFSIKERKLLMFSNPYVINKKKSIKRELLLHVNPLYGNKSIQKGAIMSCLYHALNYIRCRYKQTGHQYPKERYFEKIFSNTRRALSDLSLCEVMLLKLFDCWIKKNDFAHGQVLHVTEWIAWFKKESADIDRYAFLSLTHEKNYTLHNDAYKHLENFMDSLSSEYLSKKMSIDEIKTNLIQYFYEQQSIIILKILTKDLNLNLERLILDFFEKRNVSLESNFADVYKILPAIYMEQIARFNNLYFLTKDILKNVNILLDAVENNGALVFIFPSKILHNQKQYFIKNKHGFCIYDLEFSDDVTDHMSHAMVLVGGLIDSQGKEFVYIINPDNHYSEHVKTPIYRIPYEIFKNNLLSYDGLENEEKDYSLNRYFMYGAHGLNRTRDPIPSQKANNLPSKPFTV